MDTVLTPRIDERLAVLNWGGVKKVNLSLCLIRHHAMKAYWRIGGIAPRIL
jgi:hypothetical protein